MHIPCRQQSAGGVVLEALHLAGVSEADGGPPAKQARMSTDGSDVGSPGEHSNSNAGLATAAADKITTGDRNDASQGSDPSTAAAAVVGSQSATAVKTESSEATHTSMYSQAAQQQQQQPIYTSSGDSSYTQATSAVAAAYAAAAAAAAGDGSGASAYPSHAGYNWQ